MRFFRVFFRWIDMVWIILGFSVMLGSWFKV
jgi:hypothetical protein